MNITCISASNTVSMGRNSASTKVCANIKSIIKESDDNISVNVLPLMDYDIMPCKLCGKCSDDFRCVYDENFNQVFNQLIKSDKLFLVVPHYSPIPSKVLIILEKINEIVYSGWLKDNNFKFPLTNTPIGVIGHGGMPETDEVLDYYHDKLVTPVAKTLESLSLKPIGLNEQYNYGVVFGLKDESCIKQVEGDLFPKITHDWDMISKRIQPLVLKVLND